MWVRELDVIVFTSGSAENCASKKPIIHTNVLHSDLDRNTKIKLQMDN